MQIYVFFTAFFTRILSFFCLFYSFVCNREKQRLVSLSSTQKKRGVRPFLKKIKVAANMLRGIPACLSPELLKVLHEMGHGDTIVIADSYYPCASSARHSMLVRADGVRATELLDAILQFFPLDTSVAAPVLMMDKQACERDIPTPIWEEYRAIVRRHDKRGDGCIDMAERFDFYKKAESCYAVLATGEASLYGCLILQKGTV